MDITKRQSILPKPFIKALFLFCFLFFAYDSGTQVLFDENYDSDIHTIEFHPNGLPLSFPAITLDRGRLKLSFDDLGKVNRHFIYTVYLCDKDWNISDLDPEEYLDGFDELEIKYGYHSSNTRIPYRNYQLILPNDELDFLVSGNYILAIYDDGPEIPELVITRRFIVSEDIAKQNIEMSIPYDPRYSETHHKLTPTSVSAKHEFEQFRQQEIYLSILQNGKWDDALHDIQPYTDDGEKMFFKRNEHFYFPAGKGFRAFDTRSLQSKQHHVFSIEKFSDAIDIQLETDRSRRYQKITVEDAYGGFVTGNQDYPDFPGSTEYIYVTFTYESTEFPRNDIYVIGKLSNWQLLEKNKLKYDQEAGLYYGEILLKQGYYNYHYAVADSDGNYTIDATEGNWYGTKDEYTVIVYLSEQGGRYDRVLSYYKYLSNDLRR